MKNIFNKNFWIGFISGFMFFFLILMIFAYWCGNHPMTDCESCLNGTTP